MPVATLSPYAATPIFSEDPSEEFRSILQGIRSAIREELTGKDLYRMHRLGITSVFYDKDLSIFVGGNVTSVSRWKNDSGEPPQDMLNYLRLCFERLREDPSRGASSLMDYVRRREKAEGLSAEIDPPGPFDSWPEFKEAVGEWNLAMSYQAQVLIKQLLDGETTARISKVEHEKVDNVRRQVSRYIDREIHFDQRLARDGTYELIATPDPDALPDTVTTAS